MMIFFLVRDIYIPDTRTQCQHTRFIYIPLTCSLSRLSIIRCLPSLCLVSWISNRSDGSHADTIVAVTGRSQPSPKSCVSSVLVSTTAMQRERPTELLSIGKDLGNVSGLGIVSWWAYHSSTAYTYHRPGAYISLCVACDFHRNRRSPCQFYRAPGMSIVHPARNGRLAHCHTSARTRWVVHEQDEPQLPPSPSMLSISPEMVTVHFEVVLHCASTARSPQSQRCYCFRERGETYAELVPVQQHC